VRGDPNGVNLPFWYDPGRIGAVRGVDVGVTVSVMVGTTDLVSVSMGVGDTGDGTHETNHPISRQKAPRIFEVMWRLENMLLIVSDKEPCEGFGPSQGIRSFCDFAFDKGFGLLAADIVAKLLGWRLEKI